MVIPCSEVMLVAWKISDEWTCATPTPGVCKLTPAKMNVTFGLQPAMDLFFDALGRGMFTPEEIRQHQVFLDTQGSRLAVAARATNAAMQHRGKDGSLGIAVSEDEIRVSTYLPSYTTVVNTGFGYGAP